MSDNYPSTAWRPDDMPAAEKFGHEEGEMCSISPPCSQCVEPREYCPVCGWRVVDDM
jgi:hypothetical protein